MDAAALIADLDPDQRAAVTADSLLVAVIAGAGAGKTRVLTRRIAHRIATGRADARHTLALTFTREAAGELRRRLRRLGLHEPVEAGTFHSVMLGVLRQRWEDTGTRPQTVVEDRRRLVGDVLGAGDRRGLDALLAEIGWATARGVGPGDYAAAARRAARRPSMGIDRAATVFADFVELKRRRGVVDFDDVLSHTVGELRRDADFAAATRWRFRHLLVDEAQDLNPLQHQLVDLLRRGRDDLFLVGDPSQAIYGFNGADPSLLIEVERRFPGVEVVRLPVNHRSSPQIVRAGVHVLERAAQPAGLVSSRADGPVVVRIAGDDELDEARRVAQFVRQTDPNVLRSGDVAVLARTHAQLRSFEDAFTSLGIDVRRAANAPGSALRAAIRLAGEHGSPSRLRGWAHDTLERIDAASGFQRERPDDERIEDERTVAERPVAGRAQAGRAPAERMNAEQRIAERMNAEQRAADRMEAERMEAERRVAAAALQFLRESPRGDGARFRAWIATSHPFDDGEPGGVELLTFHAAKGREWYLVVVTGIETGLVPHRSASTAGQRAEEARLLYVAMTRATDRLVLSHAARRRGYARKPSPLLDGLDLSEPAPGPPPPSLRPRRPGPDPLVAALRQWRDDAARRADVLPTELCSDRDLATIARERPTTTEQLAATTSLGPITAARLAPDILRLVAGDGIADPTG